MGHNFVMLDRTVNTGNVQSFLDKASMEASHDYVPPDSKEVLAHTKLLGPGETDTVTFTRPMALASSWFALPLKSVNLLMARTCKGKRSMLKTRNTTSPALLHQSSASLTATRSHGGDRELS